MRCGNWHLQIVRKKSIILESIILESIMTGNYFWGTTFIAVLTRLRRSSLARACSRRKPTHVVPRSHHTSADKQRDRLFFNNLFLQRFYPGQTRSHLPFLPRTGRIHQNFTLKLHKIFQFFLNFRGRNMLFIGFLLSESNFKTQINIPPTVNHQNIKSIPQKCIKPT